jgi:hypothetical protein
MYCNWSSSVPAGSPILARWIVVERMDFSLAPPKYKPAQEKVRPHFAGFECFKSNKYNVDPYSGAGVIFLMGLKGATIEPLVPLLTFIGNINIEKSIENKQLTQNPNHIDLFDNTVNGKTNSIKKKKGFRI